MTYSNQEVPSWNIYDSEMYLTTFPELLTEEDKYFFDQDEIKPEDTYSPVYQVSLSTKNIILLLHYPTKLRKILLVF